ncbi:MAG: hypothetical protein IJ060_05790 [Oscillospiraceae bacterium]|nr:hypothetical protein [Oscillospiraceae bacterium]
MSTKKLLAALCASAMILAACTACGSSDDSSSASTAESSAAEESSAEESSAAGEDESSAEATTSQAADDSSEAETAATAATAAPAESSSTEFEEAVAAESGDAFLYINDGQFYIAYDGTAESSSSAPRMTYDAGVAKIEGNGQYTVSVRNDTNGLRYDATGDAAGDLVVSGVQFAAVIVKDGTTLYPNMSIEINEIRLDGTPVATVAKNYTSSDDGKEMRANIYNQWVNKFPDDAHTADGAVSGEFGEYSAQIIDPASFGTWKKVEVDFTVSGIDE